MLPSLKNVINLQNRDPCSKVLSLITVMLNLGGIAWAIYMVNTVYIIIYIIYGDICPKYGQLDVAYTRLGCTVKLYCTLLYNYILYLFNQFRRLIYMYVKSASYVQYVSMSNLN